MRRVKVIDKDKIINHYLKRRLKVNSDPEDWEYEYLDVIDLMDLTEFQIEIKLLRLIQQRYVEVWGNDWTKFDSWINDRVIYLERGMRYEK
jgi:hypothetical protein